MAEALWRSRPTAFDMRPADRERRRQVADGIYLSDRGTVRRLHGVPIASENFIFAKVSRENVTSGQALPAAPDLDWRPEEPPHPPGPRRPRQ